MISYSQNREDVLLNRLFPERSSGFYIDVGACYPVIHSVTKLFYDRGWRGINIEPLPSLSAVLTNDRPRDINLRMGLSNCEEFPRSLSVPYRRNSQPSPTHRPKRQVARTGVRSGGTFDPGYNARMGV